MAIYTKPSEPFSAKKFMARYGLGEFDFKDDGYGHIVTTITLPDDPPIFEPPDPPKPQGTLTWEESEIPGALRLVAFYNGKKTAIAGAIGADATTAAMYQSPGPVGPQPAGPRREFHVITKANIVDIPVPVVDGDTLYVEGDGEYRFSNGAWRRMLYGPILGAPADTPNLYDGLFTAIIALSDGSGPPVNPKIVTAFNELKKILGG